jgi:hypothetical protein
MDCDCDPAGGDLTARTDYCIGSVAVVITLTSGTGPIAGIEVVIDENVTNGMSFDLQFAFNNPVTNEALNITCGTYSIPLAYITSCHAADIQGAPEVWPFATLETWADIDGVDIEGVEMRRTISITPPHAALPVQDTGFTDAAGRFHPANFDLSALSPSLVGGETITVLWEFVDPTEGTGTCQNTVEIVGD